MISMATRYLLITFLLLATTQATAQKRAPAQIKGPDILIVEDEEKRIYEYSQNGILRTIKVVPKIGRPYYLVPVQPGASNNLLEQDGLLVPEWRIIRF